MYSYPDLSLSWGEMFLHGRHLYRAIAGHVAAGDGVVVADAGDVRHYRVEVGVEQVSFVNCDVAAV